MSINDKLGIRMKKNYENRAKTQLMRRTPVTIRIDGKAFHTFTRGFRKPFDEILVKSMQKTMKYLCENIQGCVFGYTQSDEITLILVDYQKLNSDAWFDYQVQKICSVAASMATMAFNKFFTAEVEDYIFEHKRGFFSQSVELQKEKKYLDTLYAAKDKGAIFDARCFNIPKEEVCNLIYWRQLDAIRNSVQMVGQASFSHTELEEKTCTMIQDMLIEQKGINWDKLPVSIKRGTACIKQTVMEPIEDEMIENSFNSPQRMRTVTKWIIDKNMPILKGEDRSYVDDRIYIGE